jgi:hypothetical protein
MTRLPFHLGVNYPWANYGQDFGLGPAGHRGISRPETSSVVSKEFANIRECGASVVRWFLFADGRGGFHSEKDIPKKPDDFLFRDVAAALQLARRFDLKICFSLIDYLWLQDPAEKPNLHPHHKVMQFAAGREAFLHRVLIPMFREFCEHPSLFAWEIANEPEWAIREFHHKPTAKMHFADFRAFAGEVAQAVRGFAGVPVTLGSARLEWLRAWSELGLDFYQAHYYPAQDATHNSGLSKQLAVLRTLDKPLWLGELPARDAAAPDYSLERALTDCREAGLLGAAVWRWTEPEATGSDAHLGSIDARILQAWNSASRSQSATV